MSAFRIIALKVLGDSPKYLSKVLMPYTTYFFFRGYDDVPGYADKLQGSDRDVLKLRPGITGPATLKYRLEDEYLANARNFVYSLPFTVYGISKEELDKMSNQEVEVWYNDNVIYPDKVRLNCYYYRHYSFIKDIQMIVCTVLGKKMKYAGETI